MLPECLAIVIANRSANLFPEIQTFCFFPQIFDIIAEMWRGKKFVQKLLAISAGNGDMTINESAFESPDRGASFGPYDVTPRPDAPLLGRPESGRILQFS